MREFFDLEDGTLYLNSGTHSVCPRSVLDVVAREQREYDRNPTQGLLASVERLWKVHQELGDFFGTRPQDLFLRNNVTESLNAFILGIPLQAGSEILLSDQEYGAVKNLCRFRAERDGLSLRELAIPSTPGQLQALTPGALVERVVSAIRPETSMIVLSHVMTANGLILPIAEIARETRKRGVLIAIDGAHGPGALSIDFSELQDVDFYGGNFHKWMMGPKGTSFGWVPERHQKALRPLSAGWTTFEAAGHYAPLAPHPFAARMLMTGCQDYSRFYALSEVLRFWREQGPDRIRSRILSLQKRLEEGLARLTWESVSPPRGPMRGSLLAYRLPPTLAALTPTPMAALYERHRLQISTPNWGGSPCVRFSPHIYTTEAEIDQTLEILKAYSR